MNDGGRILTPNKYRTGVTGYITGYDDDVTAHHFEGMTHDVPRQKQTAVSCSAVVLIWYSVSEPSRVQCNIAALHQQILACPLLKNPGSVRESREPVVSLATIHPPPLATSNFMAQIVLAVTIPLCGVGKISLGPLTKILDPHLHYIVRSSCIEVIHTKLDCRCYLTELMKSPKPLKSNTGIEYQIETRSPLPKKYWQGQAHNSPNWNTTN